MNPLTKDRALNLFVYGLLLLLAIVFVVGALDYSGRQRIVPLVIGLPTIGLLLFIITAELTPRLSGLMRGRGRSEDDAPGDDSTRVDAGRWQRVVTVYGWVVFYFVVTFIAGFYVAVPLFLWLFFTFESKLRPIVAVGATLASVLPLFVIFHLVLDIPLWPGILPQMVPGILGGGNIPPLFR